MLGAVVANDGDDALTNWANKMRRYEKEGGLSWSVDPGAIREEV